MFKGVHHVGYLVEDLEQSIKGQEQVFGGVLKHRATMATGVNIAFLQVGDVLIELVQSGGAPDRKPVKGMVLDHMCYEVADLDQTLAEFASRGIQAVPGSVRNSVMGGRVAFLEGAKIEGIRVQLRQP